MYLQNDDSAQIHILEMLTLFWLFFMTAAFLITVHVPDSNSISMDAELKFAGEDAINLALATSASSSEYESKLAEYLDQGMQDEACELIQGYIIGSVEANCWLSIDSATIQPYGEVATPGTNTVNTHAMVAVNGHIWTVSLGLWERGS